MTANEQEVDRQLREIALTDWNKFKEITGLDLTKFLVCAKRKEGKSLNQISQITKIHRSSVNRICKTCPE